MAQEIERKFLVNGNFRSHTSERTRIMQAYLSSAPERAVRVRVEGEKGFLTIKGKAHQQGTSRYEWEKEIPVKEARELLKICEPGMIEKIRHRVPAGRHTFEVDEFLGDNNGLIVAEVELGSPDETFKRPGWLGKEVTGDPRYYNAFLAKNPYQAW
ncbi:MAG: CYTH domain-containing protein [Bacteroidales bacterium]